MDERHGRAEAAAWALAATQVVHGLTPADTESEGYVGAVVGLVLLVLSLASIHGLRQRRPWALGVLPPPPPPWPSASSPTTPRPGAAR